jgi:3-oxoacyl-[acyl-carrier protein] reductase
MNKKVALILGGNGGIGCSAVTRLFEDGFQVCATYFNNKDNLKEKQVELGINEVAIFQCDVTSEEEVNKTINQVVLTYGEIDVVVFTVTSALKNTRILKLEWDDYSSYFDLNIKAMFFVMKALSGQINSKHKTKFIVILTEACIGSPPKGFSAYVTSKYATMGMAKTMALELAQFNCRVNMISPGMVETNLLNNLPAKMVEMSAYQNPLKRNARTSDVSSVISFLASEQADYLNGTNISVNGGNILF